MHLIIALVHYLWRCSLLYSTFGFVMVETCENTNIRNEFEHCKKRAFVLVDFGGTLYSAISAKSIVLLIDP